ncbi:OLC1v1025152C1 [Oldenlandia corymbosa var. corymbosa]|uniref:OLC1v1025152C1 n=1 Tax=Oldenlandia corymbosa var. corymbosa TaxID=529605 RepID=A0AAV1C434_OLDCO|nr:OLC1v1025152C1 [Oldenlandia corymbosa var. corymbosa]
MALSTVLSPNLPLKTPSKFIPSSQIHCLRTSSQFWTIPFRHSVIETSPLKLGYAAFHEKSFSSGFPFHHSRKFGFSLKAQKDGGMDKEPILDKAEEEARGQSTMPDRFRHLTKEAPEKPVRWPWLIALAFGLYAWRTVLWELSNWKKAAVAIVQFLGYISKLALALVLYFFRHPITSLIEGFETTFYAIRASYSWVINYAPIQELTTIIILSSAVLAISEATVPDSVNSQPYLLTITGLVGFAAVRSYITELFFWILLLGMFCFARFVKKKDYVSSAMPVAAVLAAVGEPWIRVLALGSFLALAIFQHFNQPSISSEDSDAGIVRRVPIPLLCAALAIGVRIAVKWAGYRHLTWMSV